MVKANCSFGGKLLLIFLTIVIYTVVLAGGLIGGAFYVYKKVKVSELIGIFTDPNGWISEEYDESDSNMILELAATDQEYADLLNPKPFLRELRSIQKRMGDRR